MDPILRYAYQHGASGAIAGTSNLLAKQVVALNSSLRANDLEMAQKLQDDLNPLRKVMHQAPVPSVLKSAVTMAHIADVGNARRPICPVTQELSIKIKKMLTHYNLI